ncbi:MAG: hypothetical protein AB2A00_35305 [Myxococcota bacterium]
MPPALKPGWIRGSLSTSRRALDCFAVGEVDLRDGAPLRLRGVMGRVQRAGSEWVFHTENHAMNGDLLMDHMGELAETPM